MKRRDFLKKGAIAGALGLGATPVVLGSERGFQGIKPTETVTLSYLKELPVFGDMGCWPDWFADGKRSLFIAQWTKENFFEYTIEWIKKNKIATVIDMESQEDNYNAHMVGVHVVIDVE